ncbi:hypothetical protein PHMEG_00022955 [Phytophthora megakarya]|uniref:Chromo domain-containing protein n=1 Tax=Phytophthora megakarya TaxID=4795 RepID=A0A225VHH3_9STRA|nr:hypothetical protein PHMEG_00022955 [Phytophthora megakarya]
MFTGIPCRSPLDTILLNNDPHDQPTQHQVSLGERSEAPEQQLQELRRNASENEEQPKETNADEQNRTAWRTRGELHVGDYVLRSWVDEKVGNKLLVTWIDPFVITRAESHSFRVKNLITGAESDSHASRLKFYADKELQVTEELREHVVSQGIVLKVKTIRKHRWNARINDYELLMSWQCLDATEASWEPMRAITKGVSVMVEVFAQRPGDVNLISTVMDN